MPEPVRAGRRATGHRGGPAGRAVPSARDRGLVDIPGSDGVSRATLPPPANHMHNAIMQSGEVALESVLEQVSRLVRQLATAGDLSLTAAMVLARLNRGPQRLTELATGEGL